MLSPMPYPNKIPSPLIRVIVFCLVDQVKELLLWNIKEMVYWKINRYCIFP